MKGYPYWKVGIGFALCPAFGGVVMAAFTTYDAIAGGEMGLLLAVGYFLSASLLMGGVAIFLNIFPAIILSVLYVILRLRKIWWSYVLIAVAGGAGALMWGVFISPNNKGEEYWQVLFGSWYTFSSLSIFILGSISSLVAAYFVLPKREIDDAER